MGRVGEHSLTRRRRRAGALATASPTTRRRPTHYAHQLSARGGGRHSPTSLLARGPLTTRTNLVRGVAGGTHFRALRVSARSSRARLRPPAKGTASGPLDHSPPAGRRHSLPHTKLVRVVAEPASVRRRRALRAARRTTPLAAGRRHSLPRTKLVRVVSRPPTTTPGGALHHLIRHGAPLALVQLTD